PADGLATGAGDGVLDCTQPILDALNHTAHEHAAELGEFAWQIHSEVTQDTGKSLIEQAQRGPVEDRGADSDDAAAEEFLDAGPGSSEEREQRIKGPGRGTYQIAPQGFEAAHYAVPVTPQHPGCDTQQRNGGDNRQHRQAECTGGDRG